MADGTVKLLLDAELTSSLNHDAVIQTAENKIIYKTVLSLFPKALWILNKDDEIMTQSCLNISVSYFCGDKNEKWLDSEGLALAMGQERW